MVDVAGKHRRFASPAYAFAARGREANTVFFECVQDRLARSDLDDPPGPGEFDVEAGIAGMESGFDRRKSFDMRRRQPAIARDGFCGADQRLGSATIDGAFGSEPRINSGSGSRPHSLSGRIAMLPLNLSSSSRKAMLVRLRPP